MEAYIKEANSETPSIILNPSDKMYSISGQSFPEDVNKIYLPVIEWFKSNAELIDHKICLKVDFDYINSATSKILMDVFTVLEELTMNKEHEAQIHWFYDEDDTDNMDQGRFYEKLLNIKLFLEPKTEG